MLERIILRMDRRRFLPYLVAPIALPFGNTIAQEDRHADLEGAGSVDFVRVTSDEMHLIYPVQISVQPSIRVISFNGVDITLRRVSADFATFVGVGSPNPEDDHNAWKSDPDQLVEFQPYDTAGPIGDTLRMNFHLDGKGGNGLPMTYDHGTLKIPFDSVTALRLIHRPLTVWLDN